MKADDEIKKDFKKNCIKAPERHYPVKSLKELGFSRDKCGCGQHFWALQKQKHCGEPKCAGGFAFIGDSPAKKKLGYVQVWDEFAEIHKKLGYTPIKRYPVVARWNPTTEFTIASIAAFQPYVVSGETKPPANPLVIPQFCLRFTDIDNVGITGHNVGFVMIGEHAFVPPEKYDINKYFIDHITWLNKGMGINNRDLTVHEDAWAGGGNFGPCVEFFSRGLEISNQVYMQYEATASGVKELATKVLDMGQGQERAAWFTQGSVTNYDAAFPDVIKKLYERTGIKIDKEFMTEFMQYSPFLNVQEVEDIESAWKFVAKKIGITIEELKNKIQPISAFYSVAEHSRALLVALADGALPSNVGGMYNLRVLFRRAQSFIDRYRWNISLGEICEWHAEELKKLFPELKQQAEHVKKILTVEKVKHEATKQKIQSVLHKVMGKSLTKQELVELYDSHGISPEMIKDEAEKHGRRIDVPENFYSLVAEKHEKNESETATEREEKLPLEKLPDTKALYFDDWKKTSFEGKVLKIINEYIVLDQTVFYPVSGGQLSDYGTLNGQRVIDVFKQGGIIVHKLEEKPIFKAGDKVEGVVDFERRKQLTQHHTSTHIVNAAARKVLEMHANQASARKDIDHAYIDVTHYEAISDKELEQIEKEANAIVQRRIKTELRFVPRDEAEKKYGAIIYQGGVAPGKMLRIVNIPKVDVEACGGTHLNNTAEAEEIVLLKSAKVKDGVVRIYFTAGNAARRIKEVEAERIKEISDLLKVKPEEIPSRAEELFEKWKKARKAVNKGLKIDVKELELVGKGKYKGDIIARTAEILQTQPEHVAKTLKRFLKELEEFKGRLGDN